MSYPVFTKEFYNILKEGSVKNFDKLVQFLRQPDFIRRLSDILKEEEDKSGYVRGKLNNFGSFMDLLSRQDVCEDTLVENFFSLFIDIRFSRFIHVISRIPHVMVSFQTYSIIMSNLYLCNTYNKNMPKYMLPTPTLYLLDDKDIKMARDKLDQYNNLSTEHDLCHWIVNHSVHHITETLHLDYHYLIRPHYFEYFKNYLKNNIDITNNSRNIIIEFLRVFLDNDIALLASVIDSIVYIHFRNILIHCFLDNQSFNHPCWKVLFESVRSVQNTYSDNSAATINLILTPTEVVKENQKDFFEQWLRSNNRTMRYSINTNTSGYNEINFEKTNNPHVINSFSGGTIVEEYFGSSFAEWVIVWIAIDMVTEFLTDLSSSLK